MTKNGKPATQIRVADLGSNQTHSFSIVPEPAENAQLAAEIGVLALRKVRFEGAIIPDGDKGWRIEAQLGATVVQSCVVTLDPVTTRLEEAVERRFVHDWPGVDPEADEVEMPEDDSIEPLGDVIDLRMVLQEALSLALPTYPRSTEAELKQAQFAPPGVTPMTDADAKPFAALAALKDKLEDPE